MMATIRIPKSKRSEYVTMTSPPSYVVEEEQKFRPPPEEGASRLPNTGSASAYPCAGDIIARFVEFGKVRNCLPPRVGKAEENPPAGDGSPRRCAPRNDGELGIDFFPYHVILKIKRGAAGRREPPQRLQSSNRLAGWAWAVTSFYCCKYGRTESERSR